MPSPHRQGRRAIAGMVIIIVIVVLALGTFFLDTVVPLFRRTYTIVAVFPTAPVVRSGTPVWVAGVPVGTISQIALLPPRDTLERVAVELQLTRSVAEQLRRDSRVHFASPQMIGEKVVEVLPGSATSPQLTDGDTLRVQASSADPTQIMASAGEARLALDSLMREAAGLRKQFGRRQADMAAAMRQASLARRELAALQAGMRGGSLAKLMALRQPGGPLDRAQKRMAGVQRLVGDAQRRMGTARSELAPAQKRLTTHAHELLVDVTALRALMAASSGTLGRMQHDSAFQRAIAGARADLDSLMVEAKKHPTRFVF